MSKHQSDLALHEVMAAASDATARSDWASASALWSRAVTMTGNIPDKTLARSLHQANLRYADELMQADRLDDAERLVSEAMDVTSAGASAAHARLARIAMLRSNFSQAVAHWRLVIDAARETGRGLPDRQIDEFAEACVKHAADLLRDGAFDDARALCAEVLDRIAGHPVASALAIEAAIAGGDLSDEASRLREATRRDGANTTYRKLFDVLCRMGRFDEAASMLSEALEKHPGDAVLRRAQAAFPQTRATGRPVLGKSFQGGAAADRRIAAWRATQRTDGRKRVLLAGDTAHRSNWGCRATTMGLRALIEGRAARIDFTMDVAQWPAYFGNADIGKKTPATPADIDDFAAFLEEHPNVPASRALRECDVVVLNGEGGFLDFVRAGRLLLALAYAARTVFGKPCILVNHTADLRDPRFYSLAEKVYPLLDDVVFRERHSLRQSGAIREKLGLAQAFGADAIFALPLSSDAAWNETLGRPGYYASYPNIVLPLSLAEPYIVLGGSARSRYQPRPDHDSFADYVALGRELGRRAPLLVAAIEHHEEPFLRAVADEIGAAFVGSSLPVPQALDLVARSALYVGGRWHTALKALIGGAPVVMLETNSPYKTSGLLELYDLQQPEIDFYDAGSSSSIVAKRADTLLDGGATQRQRILETSRRLAESAVENVRFLPAGA